MVGGRRQPLVSIFCAFVGRLSGGPSRGLLVPSPRWPLSSGSSRYSAASDIYEGAPRRAPVSFLSLQSGEGVLVAEATPQGLDASRSAHLLLLSDTGGGRISSPLFASLQSLARGSCRALFVVCPSGDKKLGEGFAAVLL